MSETGGAGERDYELLSLFLLQYEQAADKEAVIRSWSDQYPYLAGKFVSQAKTHQLLGRSGPDPEQAPPDRLGDFRIVRKIASGGMGVIYEAVQEPFGRRVAVKTIRSAHFSEEARERFGREQEILASLHQTHIVPIYAAGQLGDTHYFAMPYIQGASLRDLIQDLRRLPPLVPATPLAGLVCRLNGTLPAGEAAVGQAARKLPDPETYCRSVAEGLADAAEAIAHAHERGILHRDLKPANLMVDEAGHVWVLDFGLAGHLQGKDPSVPSPAGRSSGELSLPGSTVGTPDYMAPEQLTGRADVRTDVWGLGVVLYELLTLRRAFAEAPAETVPPADEGTSLERRREELAGQFTWAGATVPADVKAICAKCLEKRAEARYPSAQALADDLRHYLRHEETTVRPYPPRKRVVRWVRSHPARGALLVTGMVLLLLALMVAGQCLEIRAGNAKYARKLAGTVDRQFRLLQGVVRETADRQPLRQLLAEGQGNHARELREFLGETKKDFNVRLKWFKRPGEAPPFVNWYVMDPEGNLLTDSDSATAGGNYTDRDYARLLHDASGDKNTVHISRVFKSTQDQRYKFALAARVWEGDRLLGLVAATIGTDSKLVALDMKDEQPGAVLTCPMDWTRTPGIDPSLEALPEFIIALHRDYQVPGERPLEVTADRRSVLRDFQKDGKLEEESANNYQNGSFGDYVRVGDSPFVVAVEQPYPWPVNFILNRTVWYGSAPVLGIGCVAGVGWWFRRRGTTGSV